MCYLCRLYDENILLWFFIHCPLKLLQHEYFLFGYLVVRTLKIVIFSYLSATIFRWIVTNLDLCLTPRAVFHVPTPAATREMISERPGTLTCVFQRSNHCLFLRLKFEHERPRTHGHRDIILNENDTKLNVNVQLRVIFTKVLNENFRMFDFYDNLCKIWDITILHLLFTH